MFIAERLLLAFFYLRTCFFCEVKKVINNSLIVFRPTYMLLQSQASLALLLKSLDGRPNFDLVKR